MQEGSGVLIVIKPVNIETQVKTSRNFRGADCRRNYPQGDEFPIGRKRSAVVRHPSTSSWSDIGRGNARGIGVHR